MGRVWLQSATLAHGERALLLVQTQLLLEKTLTVAFGPVFALWLRRLRSAWRRGGRSGGAVERVPYNVTTGRDVLGGDHDPTTAPVAFMASGSTCRQLRRPRRLDFCLFELARAAPVCRSRANCKQRTVKRVSGYLSHAHACGRIAFLSPGWWRSSAFGLLPPQ